MKKKRKSPLKKWSTKWIVTGIALVTLVGAAPAFADYIMYSGDSTRTRTIKDESMDTPITYKWDIETGWSVTQPISVTSKDGKKYMYQIGAQPDSNNEFGVPAGSYLWRIPILEEDTSRMERKVLHDLMLKNGLKVYKLGPYTKTYSHITWNPEDRHFYLGWGTGAASKVMAINEDLTAHQAITIGATPIASPQIYPGGIVVIGAMDGKIRAIKGLASGKVAISDYVYDSAPNAEITAHGTGIPGTNLFGVGLNYRKSSKQGKFNLFEVVDNGTNVLGQPQAPSIRSAWDSYYITSTGVATDAAYDTGVFYFSDKGGTFYAVAAGAPRQKWAANNRHEIAANIKRADKADGYVDLEELPAREQAIVKQMEQEIINAREQDPLQEMERQPLIPGINVYSEIPTENKVPEEELTAEEKKINQTVEEIANQKRPEWLPPDARPIGKGMFIFTDGTGKPIIVKENGEQMQMTRPN